MILAEEPEHLALERAEALATLDDAGGITDDLSVDELLAEERRNDHELELVADGAPPMINDLTNARRLVGKHGHDLRHAPELGAWHVWDRHRWAEDVTGEATRRMIDVVDELRLLVTSVEDPKTQRQLLGQWQASHHASRIDGALRVAAVLDGIPVRVAELDADPWLLNTPTGTVDLRAGELRAADPADLCTKLTGAPYRPDVDCPTWRKFLEEIFAGDQELIEFLQRALGSSITGDVSEQHLFIPFGSGANGKSTLLNTVRRIVGDYGVQLAPDLLLASKHDAHPTGLTDLRGARFASTIEVEQGRQLAEALVKMLTGGENIRARRMRQDFFEFMPTHKLWLAVNHLPTVRGADLGIWRRILVVPFVVTIPKAHQDPQLPEKLWAERSGILAWLVDGCLAWQRDGLQPPASITTATDDYRSDQDHLGAFLVACCQLDRDYQVNAPALRETYENWCHATDEQPLNKVVFGRRLTEIGYPTTPDKRNRRGLRLVVE